MKVKFVKLVNLYNSYGIKKLFNFLLLELKASLVNRFIYKSYSQDYEDLIIDKILNKNIGFYVDIGGYDPIRFSNSYRFYKKGWKGIIVEPNKCKISNFKKIRSRDIVINAGVSTKNKELKYFEFIPDTLNTFSETDASRYVEEGFNLTKISNIKTLRLENILEKTLGNNKEIDFLSVDTEGFDFEVLKSNDWSRFKPHVICIEKSKEDGENTKIANFLIRLGYKLCKETKHNLIYCLSKI